MRSIQFKQLTNSPTWQTPNHAEVSSVPLKQTLHDDTLCWPVFVPTSFDDRGLFSRSRESPKLHWNVAFSCFECESIGNLLFLFQEALIVSVGCSLYNVTDRRLKTQRQQNEHGQYSFVFDGCYLHCFVTDNDSLIRASVNIAWLCWLLKVFLFLKDLDVFSACYIWPSLSKFPWWW